MWELITSGTQWTQMMEQILHLVTINGDESEEFTGFLDYPEYFPFRICAAILPSDNTGFIYILISLNDPTFVYIGQTLHLILQRHNSGHGAVDTACISNHPHVVAAYISGLAHCNQVHRMSLENQ